MSENPVRPTVVCLCGSTRFMHAFFSAGWELTLLHQIVLSIGVCHHADDHGAEAMGQDVIDRLDELHLRKIDLADWVLVLNIAGYIGSSTRKEIDYAHETGKPVILLTAISCPESVPARAEWQTWEDVAELTRDAAARQFGV